jgi:hypothetical protein
MALLGRSHGQVNLDRRSARRTPTERRATLLNLGNVLDGRSTPSSLSGLPPLPDVDNDKLGVMEVDQNNHPGDAAETNDNSVLFYDALTALLALDDSVGADNNDATLTDYLGLTDVGDVDTVSILTGLSAFGIDAPSVSAASLVPPNNQRTRRGMGRSRRWVPETLMAPSETLLMMMPWVIVSSALRPMDA